MNLTALAPSFGADITGLVGDVLVWDNIALQHGRPAFPHTEPRERGTHDLVPNVEQLLA